MIQIQLEKPDVAKNGYKQPEDIKLLAEKFRERAKDFEPNAEVQNHCL